LKASSLLSTASGTSSLHCLSFHVLWHASCTKELAEERVIQIIEIIEGRMLDEAKPDYFKLKS
jgi:hypothetical protein